MSEAAPKLGFLSRLKAGLSKTSGKLSDGITGIFTKRKLDENTLEELEELLISADLGATVAAEFAAQLSKQKFDKDITHDEVSDALANYIAGVLTPYAKPLEIVAAHRPHVVMVVGVNGNGKTTTIGKMAAQFSREGKRVMLAAADTFRAAAVEQLQVWGTRSGIPVVTAAPGSDPASLAYSAIERAKAEGVDVLFIDTAGRLQNKSNLMAELQKIVKVIKKLDESAPHSVVQVLDATTGQNALSQVEVFKSMVDVTGLVITKLDGTAKAGIVVALAKKFGLPIHAVGIGEGIDDLSSFDAEQFSSNLLK